MGNGEAALSLQAHMDDSPRLSAKQVLAVVAGNAIEFYDFVTYAFFAVQMAVFGFCLGASFAPAHKGMPIIPPEMKLDFLRRQVMVSRNVRGNPVVDWAMGGLNYQIEHHLFPNMPRCNLRKAQPFVKAHCEENGIDYMEVGLFHSYAIVVDYLNNVGIRAGLPEDRFGAAQPDYIYVLNSDAFPAPDAIRLLLDHLEAHPEVGFAGSYIHGTDGVPHTTCFRFPSVWSELEGAARTGPVTRAIRPTAASVDSVEFSLIVAVIVLTHFRLSRRRAR